VAEPTTTTAAALAVVAVTGSLIPGIDGATLIGAFSGAVIFVLSQKDGGKITRSMYGAVSGVIGYMGSGEVMRLTPITDPAIAAFALSATVITLALTAIDKIKNFDITSVWGKK
jgi:hypothetical protein